MYIFTYLHTDPQTTSKQDRQVAEDNQLMK